MLHAEMKAWDALNLSLQSPGLPSSLVDLKGTYWWLLCRRAGFCSSSRDSGVLLTCWALPSQALLWTEM